MHVTDFAKEYERKTDEELLRLALDADQLTPEANSALQAALSQRGISSSEKLKLFRDQEQARKEEQTKDPGRLWFLYPYGIGRKRFGKADYNRDPETGVERFKTTVFIVLFWLPLIPTGTYLIERDHESLPTEMAVLKKLPLDWEQVLKVWVATAAIFLALIWAMKFYLRTL